MIERIKLLMESKDLSLSQFADMIQIQRSSLSHVMNGRNKPSLDFILKILACYPEINTDWLLFGKGDMDNVPNLFSTSDEEQVDESINDYISENKSLKEENESLLELNRQKDAELMAALSNSEELKSDISHLKQTCDALEQELEEKSKKLAEEKIPEPEKVVNTEIKTEVRQIKQVLLVYDDGDLEAYDHKNQL